MTAPRRRRSRLFKWLATTSVALALLWAVSVFCSISATLAIGGHTRVLSVTRGALSAASMRIAIEHLPPWTAGVMVAPTNMAGFTPPWTWWFQTTETTSSTPTQTSLFEVRVPLWFPLLLCSAPTLWLWARDRRAHAAEGSRSP